MGWKPAGKAGVPNRGVAIGLQSTEGPEGGSMRIGYFEPLSRAWGRTRAILWQPFDLSKWLLLAFAAWVAGLTTDTGSVIFSRSDSKDVGRHLWSGLDHAWEGLSANIFWLMLAVVAVIIGVAVAVLLLWITSRFKFIFLGNLVGNRAEIVEPWKRHEALGNSLFLWRLCFAAACVVGAALVAVVFFAPAAGFSLHDALAGLSVAAGVFGSLGLLVFGLAAVFVALMTESFVIPIMYRYGMPVLDAWRAFLPWLRARPAHFVVYGLFVLMLTAIFAIFFSIFCMMTCCTAALPYLGTVLLLPVWVAYRLLSVEFLAQFHPDFDLFRPLPEDVEMVFVEEERS
jgi:hypothetical protein